MRTELEDALATLPNIYQMLQETATLSEKTPM